MRNHRSCHKGTWAKLLAAVSDDPDLEYLMGDGSIARIHPHGAAKKQQLHEAIRKSRSGLSTKIHTTVDALGNPVRLLLTSGETSEFT